MICGCVFVGEVWGGDSRWELIEGGLELAAERREKRWESDFFGDTDLVRSVAILLRRLVSLILLRLPLLAVEVMEFRQLIIRSVE